MDGCSLPLPEKERRKAIPPTAGGGHIYR